MKASAIIAGAAAWVLGAGMAWCGENVRETLDTGHLPMETLRPALEAALGEEGRFVVLPGKGQVLVIAPADRVRAAAAVLSRLEAPPPQVALDFVFDARVAPGAAGPRPVEGSGDFPFPTRYDPPRIIQQGNVVTVIPAHPTNFRRRATGFILDTGATANPDGTVTVDINAEHTRFEGFINYGSAIFTSGVPGAVPVLGQVADPRPFAPALARSRILMPVFRTTRVSTSILVRPEVHGDRVRLDLVPRLHLDTEEPDAEQIEAVFPEYRTRMEIRGGETGRINGFTGASAAFNRAFLGATDEDEGGTAIYVTPRISPGEAGDP